MTGEMCATSRRLRLVSRTRLVVDMRSRWASPPPARLHEAGRGIEWNIRCVLLSGCQAEGGPGGLDHLDEKTTSSSSWTSMRRSPPDWLVEALQYGCGAVLFARVAALTDQG